MEMSNGLLTPQEAAKFLKVDVRTIYRWLKDGTLAGVKIADSWRIRKSDIDGFFEKKTK